MSISSLEKFYRQMLPVYTSVQNSVMSELESAELQHYSGANIYRVSSRIKTLDSLVAKLQRKGLTLEPEALRSLDDVVGARIVCMFQEDLERIHQYLISCEALEVCGIPEAYIWDGMEWTRSGGFQVERKASGYGAIHYIARLSPEIMGTTNPVCSIRFELQVRTLMQEAWAALEHSVGYKNSIPDRIRGYFDSAADLLGLIDRAFQRLKNESNLLQRELDESALHDGEPINFYTLKTLAFEEFGVNLAGKPFSDLLKHLVESNLKTVAAARSALRCQSYRSAVDRACQECLLRPAVAEDYLRWLPLYRQQMDEQELVDLVSKRLIETVEYRQANAKRLLVQTLEHLDFAELATAVAEASNVSVLHRQVSIKLASNEAMELLSLHHDKLVYGCRQCFGPVTQVHCSA